MTTLPSGSLEQFLSASSKKKNKSFFPRPNIDYHLEYTNFKQQMNVHVHQHVTPGAVSHDRGRLTDHGADHIAKVIKQCGALINGSGVEITPYEAFLLLKAAHIHDIGNISGREHHEKKAAEVLKSAGFGGSDAAEMRAITRIAAVHGGSINGNHDTIASLQIRDDVMGFPVDFQKLAAILRLGDELADDITRADLVSAGLGTLPISSEIYHKYASGLHSVRVDHDAQQINMRFEFEKSDFLKRFGKGKTKVYLIHEILRRTSKLYSEMQYTSQFILPGIILRRVSVGISVYDHNEHVDEFGYRISTDGWTSGKYGSIYKLAPELKSLVSGARLNARELIKKYR
ncbi:hypothetical protein ACA106_02145 [Agrobacterium pusense]|uniref:HD domain-containing protein n=1 Tax=Agrobacterium pusense TaxID=648995 RepID=UPI0035A6FB4D